MLNKHGNFYIARLICLYISTQPKRKRVVNKNLENSKVKYQNDLLENEEINIKIICRTIENTLTNCG